MVVKAEDRSTDPQRELLSSVRALAARIRELREGAGMTQEDLAVRSRVSVSFISMIERGARTPSHETLVQLADALSVPTGELFRGGQAQGEAGEDPVRLVEIVRRMKLSAGQVDKLLSVARVMFDLPEVAAPRPVGTRTEQRRCAFAGCERPLLARGLCRAHYLKDRRRRRQR
jgi:transcriptional regulator with XRE-family HTH domain